jgi:ParB-like chromosome segregation protein Spo0J
MRLYIERNTDKIEAIQSLRDALHEFHPLKDQPVNNVRWVEMEKISPNDYNPNSVANIEMGLLYTSINHDGYTQPIVTVYDPEKNEYIIIDGFHRYYVGKIKKNIHEKCLGKLPVVVIDKPINDRMASTIRHNRARGKHSVQGMSNLVFQMFDNGWGDAEICNELGMEPEELLRLKHITGFSKLFSDAEYSRSWKTRRQILLEKQNRKNEMAIR